MLTALSLAIGAGRGAGFRPPATGLLAGGAGGVGLALTAAAAGGRALPFMPLAMGGGGGTDRAACGGGGGGGGDSSFK